VCPRISPDYNLPHWWSKLAVIIALMNHRFLHLSQLAALGFALLPSAAAQQPSVSIDEVIRKFAAKEKQFQMARANYTYRQVVRVQEIDSRGAVAGEYQEIFDILF